MGRLSDLVAGPEDIPLPFGFFPVELQDGRVEGATSTDAGGLYRLGSTEDPALICGGVPLNLLALIGAFFSSGGGGAMLVTDPPCDGGTDPAGLVDLIIAGGSVVIDNTQIAGVETRFRIDPGNARVIDVRECYVIPGFVDVHVHGVIGHDTLDAGNAIDQISAHLPRRRAKREAVSKLRLT